MYLVDALTVLVRRWYVVLAGVLVLAGGAAAVIAYVPTEHQSSGQMVLLLPPGASGTEKPVNPYLNLQAGLTTAASLVSGAASTKDVEKEMKSQGFDSEYAVAVVPGTGPLITVTAKDNDPARATATRDAMMAWIDAELFEIQEEVGTPRAQYISATRSSVSRSAEALPGSKLRALAALGAVVGLLTLVLTFGLDRLLLRRAARSAPVVTGRAAAGKGTKDDRLAHRRPPTDVPETDASNTVEDPDVETPQDEVPAQEAVVDGRSESSPDGLVLAFHKKRPDQQQPRVQAGPRRSGRSNRRGSRR